MFEKLKLRKEEESILGGKIVIKINLFARMKLFCCTLYNNRFELPLHDLPRLNGILKTTVKAQPSDPFSPL